MDAGEVVAEWYDIGITERWRAIMNRFFPPFAYLFLGPSTPAAAGDDGGE